MSESNGPRSRGRPQGAPRQHFNLNLADELAQRVRALASTERRSLNLQCEILLEKALEETRRRRAA